MPFARVGVIPHPNQPMQRNGNQRGGGGPPKHPKGITMEVRWFVSFDFLSFKARERDFLVRGLRPFTDSARKPCFLANKACVHVCQTVLLVISNFKLS